MKSIKRATPSPALVVGVLGLVAALAGTAVAQSGPEATTSVSKKQTKKIAKKQAQKQIDATQISGTSLDVEKLQQFSPEFEMTWLAPGP